MGLGGEQAGAWIPQRGKQGNSVQAHPTPTSAFKQGGCSPGTHRLSLVVPDPPRLNTRMAFLPLDLVFGMRVGVGLWERLSLLTDE